MSEPPVEFVVQYREDVLREGVRAFVWRRAVRSELTLWILLPLAGAVLAQLLLVDDRRWLTAMLVATAVLAALLIVGVWRVHFLGTIGKFRRMAAPEGHFALGENGITVSAEGTTTTMAWTAIVEVWELPRSWLFFLGPAQFFTLPLEGVPQAALDLARRKLEGLGRPMR